MGPKKIQVMGDLDDIKKSLGFLSEDVSAVRLQQKMILNLVEEVRLLKLQNAEKDKGITFLENRVLDIAVHAEEQHDHHRPAC